MSEQIETEGAALEKQGQVPGWIDPLVSSLSGRAILALLILVVVGGIVAPSTVSLSAILSILPFAAVLAVSSIGQHLIIQQRGLDISVAGIISLAAVIVTKFPGTDAGSAQLTLWIAMALGAGALAGFANGIVTTLLRVPALVTTIGMNAVLFGIALILSDGVPSGAPAQLAGFAIGLTLGVPNTIWVAALVAVVAIVLVERTTIGRRFVAVSVNAATAHAIAVPVRRYQVGTYVVAGVLYAVAGILLAGYLSVPNIFAGNFYILATVAAVVVGGNSVAGGARGSVLSTVIGAVFLTYLSQLVLSAGLDRSMQNVVQALIVLGGVGLPILVPYLRNRRAGAAAVQGAAVPATGPAEVTVAQDTDRVSIMRLEGIQKTFGPVHALKNVNFSVRPGEVHAVLGENGAGKSTLISIASGVFRPTRGSVMIDGRDVTALGPKARREAGISVAYQHPSLAEDLTVFENLQLAMPSLSRPAAEALFDQVATSTLRPSIDVRVETLSLAQLHVVEIVRALSTNPRILVLDEPTEPFQHEDVDKLFELIRALRDRGVAIVYISHRLHEVTQLADRISILRDGMLVAARPADQFTGAEIIKLIAGRPLGQIFPDKARSTGDTLIEARNLSGDGFHDVSLAVRAGEIVGLAGIEGEGQREFLRALAGLNTRTGGTLTVNDTDIRDAGPAAVRRVGAGFIPDDRHAEGLFLNLSIRENIGAGVLDRVSGGYMMRPAAERALANDMSTSLGVRAHSVESEIASLSGGNQQKVLFARELASGPRVLLIDEPTKGVDIGARTEIYQKLRTLADNGAAIVVAASDGVELEGLCDRVLVFSRGAVSTELTGEQVTDSEITEANLTATGSRVGQATAPGSGQTFATLKHLLTGEHFPALVLGVLTLMIAVATNLANPYFLTGFNITQMLFLLSILALISLGQFATIMVGGIDLSVGPLAGFVVVMASFVMQSVDGAVPLLGICILLVGGCALFGLFQGFMVARLQLPAIVVTLASFIGLQGVSLLLRPRPAGRIDADLNAALGAPVLGVPVAMWLTLAVVILVDIVLFRSNPGRKMRAVGSNPGSSVRLGVNRPAVVCIAFALSGALTGVAGLILAAQIGIGSGTTGVDFTLMSITAVVLAGVSVKGGRGAAIAVLFGAALVQSTMSASSFLAADTSLQYLAIGSITLAGACLFSLVRRNGRAGVH